MNKHLLIFLFVAGLTTYVNAAHVNVSVGGPNGENIFLPKTVYATVGDKVIFNWVSGSHHIIESDKLGSCTKSVKADAFSSEGIFTAPNKTMILSAEVPGIKFFYCDIPGHCEGGTLVIDNKFSTLGPSLDETSTNTHPKDNRFSFYFNTIKTPIIIIGTLMGVTIIIMVVSLLICVKIKKRTKEKMKKLFGYNDNILFNL
ncbi:hypothetical protein RclHR1_01450018 [Rhizophagus clarus]|uniref:Phytocyanin domain-containing protein n=1 Tax=Rhizophagus clarus TaxID=94130 RepID=A0A2Z6QCQ5_9GLOM|nr:hypothetical protein RclHR1_01450018 [Rhizophagus clarus]